MFKLNNLVEFPVIFQCKLNNIIMKSIHIENDNLKILGSIKN